MLFRSVSVAAGLLQGYIVRVAAGLRQGYIVMLAACLRQGYIVRVAAGLHRQGCGRLSAAEVSKIPRNWIHLIWSSRKLFMDKTVPIAPAVQQQDSNNLIIFSIQLIHSISIIKFLFHLPTNNSPYHYFIHI